MTTEQLDYDPELTSAGIDDDEYLPMTLPDESAAPQERQEVTTIPADEERESN